MGMATQLRLNKNKSDDIGQNVVHSGGHKNRKKIRTDIVVHVKNA